VVATAKAITATAKAIIEGRALIAMLSFPNFGAIIEQYNPF
jgi:hypothetical protein